MNTHTHNRWMTYLRTGHLVLALIALFVLGTGNAVAQGPNPPEILAYQGFLTDASGTPLGNPNPKNYDVIFRIWSSESGGAAGDLLWSEQQTVTVDNGFFSVMLGEGGPPAGETAPPLSFVFSGVDASVRWVGITVKSVAAGGGDLDILPRLRLLTSPYSFLATQAQTMDASGLTGTVPVNTMDSSIARRNTANSFSGNQTMNNNLTVAGTQTVNTSQRINGNQRVTGTATFDGRVTANNFVGNGTIPIGGIIMWSGATVPNGWSLCNGQNGTPNLVNRFVYGGTTAQAGNTGGEARVTLSVEEMPEHEHDVNPQSFNITGGSHRHSIDADYGSGIGGSSSADRVLYNGDGDSADEYTENSLNHTHSVNVPNTTSTSTGGDQSHNNMPPYYVLAFIQRKL